MSVARAIDLRREDLAGRSWAGYLRGSTCGQADRYGPDLQRAEQCQFAERHGLLPTGREYVDLVSGKDTLRRTDFARIAVAMAAQNKPGSLSVRSRDSQAVTRSSGSDAASQSAMGTPEGDRY